MESDPSHVRPITCAHPGQRIEGKTSSRQCSEAEKREEETIVNAVHFIIGACLVMGRAVHAIVRAVRIIIRAVQAIISVVHIIIVQTTI